MIKDFLAIVTGIGFLIGLYIFIVNGDKTVKIITAFGDTGNETIRNLQGR